MFKRARVLAILALGGVVSAQPLQAQVARVEPFAGGTQAIFFTKGLGVDAAGNVYVGDARFQPEGHHTIQKVTPAGDVTTLAGLKGASGSADGLGSAARFFTPSSVVVDAAG